VRLDPSALAGSGRIAELVTKERAPHRPGELKDIDDGADEDYRASPVTVKPPQSADVNPHTVVPLCGSGLKSKPPETGMARSAE
jgi:hypothetical protein